MTTVVFALAVAPPQPTLDRRRRLRLIERERLRLYLDPDRAVHPPSPTFNPVRAVWTLQIPTWAPKLSVGGGSWRTPVAAGDDGFFGLIVTLPRSRVRLFAGYRWASRPVAEDETTRMQIGHGFMGGLVIPLQPDLLPPGR